MKELVLRDVIEGFDGQVPIKIVANSGGVDILADGTLVAIVELREGQLRLLAYADSGDEPTHSILFCFDCPTCCRHYDWEPGQVAEQWRKTGYCCDHCEEEANDEE